MRCPVCSAEAAADALFCAHCGAKLPQHAPNEAHPAPAPAAGDASTSAVGRRRSVADVPEETLWQGSYAPRAMLGTAILATVATLVLLAAAALLRNNGLLGLVPLSAMLVLWLLVASRFAARRLGIHYKLTNQMFYHQRGVLTRVTDRIEVIGIDDVTYVQGPIERLVNVGSIKLRSSDPTNPEFTLQGVDDVEAVARLVDKARRAERLRRGMSVESLSMPSGATDGGAAST